MQDTIKNNGFCKEITRECFNCGRSYVSVRSEEEEVCETCNMQNQQIRMFRKHAYENGRLKIDHSVELPHPSFYLCEILDEMPWLEKEIGDNCPRWYLRKYVGGEVVLGKKLCEQLAFYTNTTPEIWINLNEHYQRVVISDSIKVMAHETSLREEAKPKARENERHIAIFLDEHKEWLEKQLIAAQKRAKTNMIFFSLCLVLLFVTGLISVFA